MSLTQKNAPLFDGLDAVWAVISGGVAGAVYVRTLVPGLLTGDSGEFQVLAYQAGVTHTTGYPIYILFAKLFATLVPVGSIAYRINLFSAVMGALAVAASICGAGAGAPPRRRTAGRVGARGLLYLLVAGADCRGLHHWGRLSGGNLPVLADLAADRRRAGQWPRRGCAAAWGSAHIRAWACLRPPWPSFCCSTGAAGGVG